MKWVLKICQDRWWVNPLLSLISVLFIFLLLEFLLRAITPEPLLRLKDFRARTRDLYKLALPIQYDSLLGWIPKTGFSSNENMWGTNVTILEHGIRSNDNYGLQLRKSSPVLVVGDSFTFGDQVSNNETWPAILERHLKRPVLNAGVFAYGLDQIFLRLKILIPIYKPDAVIFSFIPLDIERCEHSIFMGGRKPYFIIKDNSLVLMNTPVKSVRVKPDKLRDILGYSLLIHKIMLKINPVWWLQEDDYYEVNENYEGHRGKDVACLIFKEVGSLVREYQIHNAYILVQDISIPTGLHSAVDYALDCVDTKIIKIVDLRKELSDIKITDPERYSSYFNGHMTYEGNKFIAEKLFEVMNDKQN